MSIDSETAAIENIRAKCNAAVARKVKRDEKSAAAKDRRRDIKYIGEDILNALLEYRILDRLLPAFRATNEPYLGDEGDEVYELEYEERATAADEAYNRIIDEIAEIVDRQLDIPDE